METMFLILAIVLGIGFLVGPILAIVAYNQAHRLERRMADLERQFNDLRTLRGTPPPAEAPPRPTPPGPEPEPEAAEAEIPAEPVAPAAPETTEPQPAAEEPAAAAHGSTPWAAVAPKPALEERLTSRWLVWLGGVTLALGGGFLVKVSIDYGLLGPSARCILGVLLGLLLTVGGEWLRRRPGERAGAAVSPSAVPPALTAAGICILFASIYAAYGLYALIPPPVAFVLLALTALAAVALSLLQGPFVGLLGLIGGFANPLLVSTDQPLALALFPYLMILVAGSLAVARYKGWRWMDWSALAGSALWTLYWYAGAWQRADTPVIAVFLVLLVACFVTAHHGVLSLEDAEAKAPWWRDMRLHNVAVVAAAVVAVLVLMLVRLERYGTSSLIALGAIAFFYLFSGRRAASLIALPVIASLLTLAALALWHLPQIITRRPYLIPAQGEALGFAPGPILPPEFLPFVTTSALFAALFGLAGLWALWGARRPGFWASLAAGMPLAVLAIAYWRIEAFQVGLPWAVAGLALAALYLAILRYLMTYETASGLSRDVLGGAMGAFAVGVVAAITLAITMSLREAWLTVALSAQLPAMAWIASKLDLKALRGGAWALAIAILVRLVLNENVLVYGPIETPVFNWLLYGYGLPAVAFYLAMVMFRRKADDRLVMLLEAGTLVFVVLLVTLEIHQFFTGGRLGSLDINLAEEATQILAWLAIALGLLRLHGRDPRPVLLWGWRCLAAWSVGHLLLGSVLFLNPLLTGGAVGDWPLLNLLALAYGAPALLALAFSRIAHRQGHALAASVAGVVGLLLIFVQLSLEIRRAFHGSYLDVGATGDLEWYCYSLAWLLYAVLLLALGIITRLPALRYASLIMVLLTIAKVFLFDMAELTGVYRALSFIGLGASLVGIGYLYRRFVFPVGGPTTSPPGAAGGEPVPRDTTA